MHRTQPPFGRALGTTGTAGHVHLLPPQEDIPCSTARDVSASQAAPAAPPPCHTAVVASKYSTDTMVKATCDPDFTTSKPRAGSSTGSRGSQDSRSGFLTLLCSVWIGGAKIGNFIE